jgi:hypothetical protein
MHDAVLSVLGPERLPRPGPTSKFLAHVSIGYITYDGDPKPIAAALGGLTTRDVAVTFTKADLLEFHRDRPMYEWTQAFPVRIGSVASNLREDGRHSGAALLRGQPRCAYSGSGLMAGY